MALLWWPKQIETLLSLVPSQWTECGTVGKAKIQEFKRPRCESVFVATDNPREVI